MYWSDPGGLATIQVQIQRAHAAAAAIQHPETADGAPDYTPAGRHANGTCVGIASGHPTCRPSCAYCMQFAAWQHAARSAPPTTTAEPPLCGKMGSPTAARFATALRGRMDFQDAEIPRTWVRDAETEPPERRERHASVVVPHAVAN